MFWPVVWDCNNNEVDDYGYIYTVVDGIRYALKDGEAIIMQSKNITSVNIPSSITYNSVSYLITSICGGALSACDLTDIVIPISVAVIGGYAFEGCDNLTSVYYGGTAEDWANIAIGTYNEDLTNATRYYYVENEVDVPQDGGNYWHYVDGVPTAW